MKRPAFQFYPGDWLQDASLRMCSIGARGLWIDMICLMHQGSPYGHLKVKDKVITEVELARLSGGELGEVKCWLSEMEDAGVFSRTDEGVIFSRRMTQDERLREARSSGGKEGGNPKLKGGYNKEGFVYAMRRSSDGAVKIGISQDPAKRLYKVRAQFPADEIKVIGKAYVQDMGAKEQDLHTLFASKKSGEWFSLTDQEIGILLNLHLKVNGKENEKVKPTPSSSSSSSINNLTTPGAPSRDDVLRDIRGLRVPDTPANNTDWVNAFLGLGYAHHELMTANLVPMYADWCKRHVSLGTVLDAMEVASVRLGRPPDNPGYLRNIVEDLLRQSSRSPPGRGRSETVRTTTGGSHAGNRKSGSAVDRVIAANAHALGIDQDEDVVAGECSRF